MFHASKCGADLVSALLSVTAMLTPSGMAVPNSASTALGSRTTRLR